MLSALVAIQISGDSTHFTCSKRNMYYNLHFVYSVTVVYSVQLK